MPVRTIWSDPDLFLNHGGVRVFHTYKNDDLDQGVRPYWFTVRPACGLTESPCDADPCPHVFDVRALATWPAPVRPPLCVGEHDTPANHAAWEEYWEQEAQAIHAALITAIDRRVLTAAGVRWEGSAAGAH